MARWQTLASQGRTEEEVYLSLKLRRIALNAQETREPAMLVSTPVLRFLGILRIENADS